MTITALNRRTWKMGAVITVFGLSLTACAQPEPPKIEVKGDVYCDIAQKVRWSQADTVETVRQVVRENAKHDRVCGVKTS